MDKWTFHSNKSSICSENSLIAITKRISKSINNNNNNEYINRTDDRIEIHGALLHLPCMVFNKNIISLTSPNGLKISFVAEDALKLWVLEHIRCRELGEEINKISVPFAWKNIKNNSNSNPNININNEVQDIPKDTNGNADALQTHWDWTFSCTDYCGTISIPDQETQSSNGYKQYLTSARYISKPMTTTNTNTNTNTNPIESESVFPFISSTSPSISNLDLNPNPNLLNNNNVQWEPCEASGVNKQLLQERDEIVFYDEVILYQDDLEDCGEVTLSVKVRGMPKCWFILMRLYLRIDGGVIRVRDTRVFHEYPTTTVEKFNPNPNPTNINTNINESTSPSNSTSASDYIYMDVTWHESTLTSIESSIGHGNKIMESTLRGDPSSIMMAMPMVNDKEHIGKHFRMKIN